MGFGVRHRPYQLTGRKLCGLGIGDSKHRPPWPICPPALTVSVGWVVIEDAAGSPVIATQNDEVALVVGGAAEAAVATGSEAAVLDRAGAQVTV